MKMKIKQRFSVTAHLYQLLQTSVTAHLSQVLHTYLSYCKYQLLHIYLSSWHISKFISVPAYLLQLQAPHIFYLTYCICASGHIYLSKSQ